MAYAIGLLSTGIFRFPNPYPSWQQWTLIALGFGSFSTGAAVLVPRFWPTGPRARIWLSAGIIALLAVVYFQVRLPQPDVNDISQRWEKVGKNGNNSAVTVEGKVLEEPRLTRSQRVQFWFEAQQLKGTKVTGKLYVTVPLLQGTGLYPGQRLAVTGNLYQPQSAPNPGAFDFQAYLARQGSFAGLKGVRVTLEKEGGEPPWGLWKLRQRIVRAQVRWLSSPAGPLVSSMVLGSRAVDLPYDIRDQFIQAGLAHVLAASGFQVSLLIGVAVALTGSFSLRSRLILGLTALALYVGLTGVQPSVMRAALMGVGVLIALGMERKVRPLGSLLLAATVLLLWNPLWIWDLGFQLSFLATLGLMVSAPALEKRLDWLPSAIATSIAIPLAASLWTLPLLMFVFSTVATYSIPVNILSAPLVAAISLGGMASALAAAVWPLAGSAIACLLYYPTHLFIGIVEFFTALPGSSLATGKISLAMLLLSYGGICLVWLSRWWQRRWWLVGLFSVTLIVVPIGYSQLTRVQVTVLAARQEPVLVIQDRGKVTLISHGKADTARYTLLPFLAQQGINQIEQELVLASESGDRRGWFKSSGSFPVARSLTDWQKSLIKYQPLSLGERISIGSTAIELVSAKPPLLQLQISDRTWWLLGSSQTDPKDLQPLTGKIAPQVLLWSGKHLPLEWLAILKPNVAIAASSTVARDTQQQLQQKQIQLYWTGRDGAIQWTPERGFQKTLEAMEQDSPLV